VSCTIGDLAQKIIELTGSSARIDHKPLPLDDPRQRQPDITAAGTQLGWSPEVDLRGGLMRTIAYFEQMLSRPGIQSSP
jgi:UDP-glucuronate decarboxylase